MYTRLCEETPRPPKVNISRIISLVYNRSILDDPHTSAIATFPEEHQCHTPDLQSPGGDHLLLSHSVKALGPGLGAFLP